MLIAGHPEVSELDELNTFVLEQTIELVCNLIGAFLHLSL